MTTTGVCLVLAGIVVAALAFSAIAEAIRRMRKSALDLGEPPPLSDERDDEVLRVMRKDSER
jgi:hypothetical protein